MKKNLFFVALVLSTLFGCSKQPIMDSDQTSAEQRSAKAAIAHSGQLSALTLSPNLRLQFDKLIAEGLTADTVNGRINMFNDLDSLVAFIDSKTIQSLSSVGLTIPYTASEPRLLCRPQTNCMVQELT